MLVLRNGNGLAPSSGPSPTTERGDCPRLACAIRNDAVENGSRFAGAGYTIWGNA